MMDVVMVEYRFDEPLAEDGFDQLTARLAPCLAVREVVRLQSYLSVDRKQLTSVFSAVDAGAVRYAHGSAGVPYAAVWPARELP